MIDHRRDNDIKSHWITRRRTFGQVRLGGQGANVSEFKRKTPSGEASGTEVATPLQEAREVLRRGWMPDLQDRSPAQEGGSLPGCPSSRPWTSVKDVLPEKGEARRSPGYLRESRADDGVAREEGQNDLYRIL